MTECKRSHDSLFLAFTHSFHPQFLTQDIQFQEDHLSTLEPLFLMEDVLCEKHVGYFIKSTSICD